MNLNERLKKSSLDLLTITEEGFVNCAIELTDQVFDRKEKDILKESFFGSQAALICEYYLKGLILPELKITTDNSDSEVEKKLKMLAAELTDEEKYRIIISDDSIFDEIIAKYGSKYGLKRSKIKDLGRDSLKYYSHDLAKMVNKLLEIYQTKLNNPKLEKNNEPIATASQKLLCIRDVLEEFDHRKIEGIKDGFPNGRYGFLSEYDFDLETLRDLMFSLRDIAMNETQGALFKVIDLNATNSFNNPTFFDGQKVVYFEGIKKIFILNDGEINRVYSD